ncbi:TraR/DksA family transcriptional regulator [Paludisphaera mucosa]|uniref:TraR/DksA C4-type zinc finger protein n=1 Tax=Paludisphaera mucosa TaxID=3030827 RepID=A0ABT6FCD9_9BACT|nr:TraR/DksA C4-type zinc finger protein [Paludisphaera mucosa]MDG3005257.1 TraR/DksA C4-type zinc finger protein [Paludisphaera mucosa]
MATTRKRTEQFRRILETMDARVRGDLQSLEEQTRKGLGGESGGDLSGAPMHLGDLGTEQYMQELNATLFENEAYIRLEIRDALGRLDRDEYGLCERCGEAILEERLEVLPYTRYCTPCSAAVADGADVNLNNGRPQGGMVGLELRQGDEDDDTAAEDLDDAATDAAPRRGRDQDVHAAGTAGGGTAIGGLAGTNIGDGDPDVGDLEDATANGDFDQAADDDHEDAPADPSPAKGGGARTGGRKAGGGRAPRSGRGEKSVGR